MINIKKNANTDFVLFVLLINIVFTTASLRFCATKFRIPKFSLPLTPLTQIERLGTAIGRHYLATASPGFLFRGS